MFDERGGRTERDRGERLEVHLYIHGQLGGGDPAVVAKLNQVLVELSALKAQGAGIVSRLSDKLAEVDASLDAAIGRVQEDVGTLRAQIAELEAKVAENPTPEDEAKLEAMKAKADALDPVVAATLPPVE